MCCPCNVTNFIWLSVILCFPCSCCLWMFWTHLYILIYIYILHSFFTLLVLLMFFFCLNLLLLMFRSAPGVFIPGAWCFRSPSWLGSQRDEFGWPRTADALEQGQWKNLRWEVTLWLFNIAMENCPFIDGLPIKNGDFPWLCEIIKWYLLPELGIQADHQVFFLRCI